VKVTDVLVVGAGPTGLTLACLLRRRGVDVRVVDRLPAPAPLAKAMVLWSRSLEVLEEIGAAHHAVGQGVDLERARYLTGAQERAAVRTNRVPGTRWQPTILPQNRLETLLRARLEQLGGSVEFGVEVTGVVDGEDGVEVTTLTGDGAIEHIDAAYVVGCDGLRSTVREAAGIEWDVRAPYEEVFQLGDVEAETDLDRSTVHHFLGRNGVSVAIPMPGGLWRVVGYLDGEDPEEAPDAAALQRLLDECDHEGTTVGTVHWAGSFRVLRRLAGSFRSGRLLLAGDAAHVHSPAGGQGLNTGVQDAHNLAWKLALVLRGAAKPALLDTYTEERRPIAARILRLTQLQDQRLFGARSGLSRGIRNRVLRTADRRGLLERRLIPDLAQVLIDYRRSSLSSGWAPRQSLYRPGRLLPDVEVGGLRRLQPEGEVGGLRLRQPQRLALVAVPGRRAMPDLSDLRELADRHAIELHVLDHPLPGEDSRASYLLGIRPDGHVGYRGPCLLTWDLEGWVRGALALRAAAPVAVAAPLEPALVA
jgi:2-polyprenyl-6-methoxyphenol hydroxylase-like FAD-dependent oxidoreductase